MNVIALDWNATRVSAVQGSAGEYPLLVPLAPAGAELTHALPFLGNPAIGEPAASAAGCNHGGKKLDARQACDVVWRKLQPLGKTAQGILVAVPAYLQASQAESLLRLGDLADLPMLGSMPATLAAALAGYSEQFWQQSVLVVDVDEHALTVAWVKAMADNANLIESRSFTNLGAGHWKKRLINSLADLCVWQHRIDPRDAPRAEQSLYDQLDILITAGRQHRAIQLGVQSEKWFKHLLVHPEQTEQFCAPFVRQVLQEIDHLIWSCPTDALPRGILMTHQAGQLPGLADAMLALTRSGPDPDAGRRAKLAFGAIEEDLGDELLFNEVEELAGVLVLAPEAPARSAHGLAGLFRDGLLPIGHRETIVPLPSPQPADTGPARLHFQGRDFLLRETSFVLGSQFGCQLCFDRHEHPEVAAKHCEIVFEHRSFVLHNHAREGTLVNDQSVGRSMTLHAGDRIRLGTRGPVVRFLGRSLPRIAPAHVS